MSNPDPDPRLPDFPSRPDRSGEESGTEEALLPGSSTRWLTEAKAAPWPEALDEPGRLAAFWRRFPPAPAPAPPSGREFLPLVIGVTGHRDPRPEDLPSLRGSLRGVFATLRAHCPHTPLLLLSALADGADRLTAEVFLETPGARLAVPLPLELGDYLRTIDDRAAFEALLARAENVFLIPEPPPVEDGPGMPEPDYRREPHCYAALGAFLVERSHLLLALWDGKAIEKIGGTSQVARQALTGQAGLQPGLRAELLPLTGHPLLHIHTPRRSGPDGPAETDPVPGTAVMLAPAEPEDSLDLFRLTLDRLETFNRRLPALDGRNLVPDLWPVDREGDLTQRERLIQALQTQAEALAGGWSGRLRRRLKALFVSGWVALIGFQVYRLVDFFAPGRPLWPYILACCLATAAVLAGYAQAHLGGWQNKHLSYRGLAEAWRVQFYWRVFGVERSVARQSFSGERVEDYGETRWLRLALAYTEFPAGEDLPAPAGDRDRRLLARELWLGRQRRFFLEKSAAARRKKEECLWPAIVTLALGSVWVVLAKFFQVLADVGHLEGRFLLIVFLSLVMFVAAFDTYHRLSRQVGDHRKWLAVVLAGSALISLALFFPQRPLSPGLSLVLSAGGVIFLGTGGLFVGFLKLSAHAENARRYEASERLFSRALELLALGAWPEREVIAFLGRRALMENSVWLRQHLERPINLPIS